MNVSHYAELIQQDELEMFNAAKREPDPVTPVDEPRVIDLVAEDLRIRAEEGRKKYGCYLYANNGREALIDAYQEVLDLAMYLRQRIKEELKK